MKNKIVSFLILSVIFSGCKKDDVQNSSTAVTVNADGTLNIADADGALYAIEQRIFDTYNSSGYDDIQYASAWFGKFPAFVSAGSVKLNNNEIDNLGNYYMSVGVLSFGDTLFKSGSSIAWNVQGATGVQGFSHTDNTSMPAAPNFSLPASININNNLTISHSATTGNPGVLYTLEGDNGDTTKYVAGSSTGITFTSSEIKSVALAHSSVAVFVMPVTYTTATYGGKKYYFVKQRQYARETATQ